MSQSFAELSAALGMVDIARDAIQRGEHPVATLMDRFPTVSFPLTVEASRLAHGDDINEFWKGALEAAEHAERGRYARQRQ